jgi:hypothetical protein
MGFGAFCFTLEPSFFPNSFIDPMLTALVYHPWMMTNVSNVLSRMIVLSGLYLDPSPMLAAVNRFLMK